MNYIDLYTVVLIVLSGISFITGVIYHEKGYINIGKICMFMFVFFMFICVVRINTTDRASRRYTCTVTYGKENCKFFEGWCTSQGYQFRPSSGGRYSQSYCNGESKSFYTDKSLITGNILTFPKDFVMSLNPNYGFER